MVHIDADYSWRKFRPSRLRAKREVDTLVEWTKVTVQTEQLAYPIHKLEIHAFTTKGGGAHEGFDKPVWVDDFTIEYRSLEF